MLDTLRTVDTPEGVELSLPIAGAVSRVRAWFCDILIKMLLFWVALSTLRIYFPRRPAKAEPIGT